MTGWRIGFAVGDAKIIKAMIDIASQATSNRRLLANTQS